MRHNEHNTISKICYKSGTSIFSNFCHLGYYKTQYITTILLRWYGGVWASPSEHSNPSQRIKIKDSLAWKLTRLINTQVYLNWKYGFEDPICYWDPQLINPLRLYSMTIVVYPNFFQKGAIFKLIKLSLN